MTAVKVDFTAKRVAKFLARAFSTAISPDLVSAPPYPERVGGRQNDESVVYSLVKGRAWRNHATFGRACDYVCDGHRGRLQRAEHFPWGESGGRKLVATTSPSRLLVPISETTLSENRAARLAIHAAPPSPSPTPRTQLRPANSGTPVLPCRAAGRPAGDR